MEYLTKREKVLIARISRSAHGRERWWQRPLQIVLMLGAAGFLISALVREQPDRSDITTALIVIVSAAYGMDTLNFLSIIRKLSRQSPLKEEIAKVDLTAADRSRAIFMIVLVVVTAVTVLRLFK